MNVIDPPISEIVKTIDAQEGPKQVVISKDLYSQTHYVSFISRDVMLTVGREYANYEKAEKSALGWLDGTYDPQQ